MAELVSDLNWLTFVGGSSSIPMKTISDIDCFAVPVGEDMMNPYNITPNSDEKKFGEVFTEWTYPQWSFPSVPGCLYIFRSYMEHMVQLKKNTDRRTVLAYNYNKER